MRVMTFLVVAALAGVGFAGCFGKSDSGADNGGANTTTPTTATPTTNSTGGTTGGTNSTGGTTTMAPKELVKDTCDFSQNAPANPAGLPLPSCPIKKFTPDAGYTKITVNVTIDVNSGLPAAPTNGVQVKVGTFTCAGDSPQTASKTCPVGSLAAAAGQIEYSGSGAVTAHVTIIES